MTNIFDKRRQKLLENLSDVILQFAWRTHAAECYDMALNCVENDRLCNNPIYQTLMTQQCENTCQPKLSLSCTPTPSCSDAKTG